MDGRRVRLGIGAAALLLLSACQSVPVQHEQVSMVRMAAPAVQRLQQQSSPFCYGAAVSWCLCPAICGHLDIAANGLWRHSAAECGCGV